MGCGGCGKKVGTKAPKNFTVTWKEDGKTKKTTVSTKTRANVIAAQKNGSVTPNY